MIRAGSLPQTQRRGTVSRAQPVVTPGSNASTWISFGGILLSSKRVFSPAERAEVSRSGHGFSAFTDHLVHINSVHGVPGWAVEPLSVRRDGLVVDGALKRHGHSPQNRRTPERRAFRGRRRVR